MKNKGVLLNSLLAVSFLHIHNINAQKNCLTPTNKMGVCIHIKECEPLMKLFIRLKQDLLLPKFFPILQLIKQSKCGFQGEVCCQNKIIQEDRFQKEKVSEPDLIENTRDIIYHKNLRLLNHQLCGEINTERITGGNKTGVWDFPWMALIAYKVNNHPIPEFRCGGSIINNRYILTAAHCLAGLPQSLKLWGVRVGEHDLRTEKDCSRNKNGRILMCAAHYQDLSIENSYYHPEFSKIRMQNDIALLRLTRNIDFSFDNARPICMPIGSGATLIQKKVVITGWGTTEFGIQSLELLQARIPVIPNEECARFYKNIVKILQNQICAGGEYGIDACTGDSGGPLQSPGKYINNEIRMIQYGVVSFGLDECGSKGYPSVYTRVSYYMNWILKNIRQ